VLFTQASLRLALTTSGFLPEPAICLRLGAQDMFRRSMRIRRGKGLFCGQPALPLKARIEARCLAWRTDRATRINPELSAELVLLAHKPGGA
jgi:hypothetical protein